MPAKYVQTSINVITHQPKALPAIKPEIKSRFFILALSIAYFNRLPSISSTVEELTTTAAVPSPTRIWARANKAPALRAVAELTSTVNEPRELEDFFVPLFFFIPAPFVAIDVFNIFPFLYATINLFSLNSPVFIDRAVV
jgi:hypothetical protein